MDEKIKRKLFDLEINPPEKMWEKISAALDDEVAAEFPFQLYDLELNPPSKVWSSIATDLDYSEKLHNLELQPPVDAWQKISAALDEEKAIPRIPSRRIALWKYIAAASLLALIGFGVKWLTSERTGSEVAIQSPQIKKTETQQKNQEERSGSETISSTEENKPADQQLL